VILEIVLKVQVKDIYYVWISLIVVLFVFLLNETVSTVFCVTFLFDFLYSNVWVILSLFNIVHCIYKSLDMRMIYFFLSI
jgi:hypothetical protein